MTYEIEKEQAYIKRKILIGIGEHISILTNRPLLMATVLPLLISFILLFYGFNSGLLTKYQSTLTWCNLNWLHCGKIGIWLMPWWFIVRTGIIILPFIVYWPMRWAFEKENWKIWWIFYAIYGYTFLFALSSMFSCWLYILPVEWQGWTSLLETMLLLGFLSRGYWIRKPIDFIEKMLKAMLPLAGITGVLGAAGVNLGRTLSKTGSLALPLLIIGIVTFMLIIIPTSYYWEQKIWASNPWFLTKGIHKKGEVK